MVHATLVALLLVIPAAPAHGAPEGTPSEGVLTRPPAVLEGAEPEYPPEAKAAGLGGEVVLELEISEGGEVTSAVVTQPAGHGFDEAALAAARKLRFTPAQIDNEAAAVRIEYRFKFAFVAAPAGPPPANLRGVVRERGTRRPVAAALVEAGGQSAYTDAEGHFGLVGVPEGKVKVTVLSTGHERYEVEETIAPGEIDEVKYWLLATDREPYEAVVVGEREEREVSRVALSAGEISRVPGVSGDAVKVIQNLPGVARAPGGFGLLVVRGGNPRDTRVYVDGLEVPLVFHFGGLTSVYSSDLLRQVEFEPGNFGVRSGRAIGGRVNLVTRDPGDRTHALADANLYHATALAESRPREDLGVAVAARRSYADAMLTAAARTQPDAPTFSLAPRYYDFQGKLAWTPTPDDRLRLDVFGSNDRMVLSGVKTGGLRDIDQLRWGTAFTQLAATWDRRLGDATRAHVQLGLGWMDVELREGDVYSERDRMSTTALRADLSSELSPALVLAAGLDGVLRPDARVDVLAPEFAAPGQLPSPDPVQALRRLSSRITESEAGAWVEATVKPSGWLTIVPGVRVDTSRLLRQLSWIDPRVAVRVALGPTTSLKAAAGLYHQLPPYPYLTREWGNPDLGPEAAWQYAVGTEHRMGRRVFLDVQLYYKRLFDLALPTDALVSRDGTLVPERFTSAGTGRAYGAEILLRWDPDGRFFGWLAYSLSRSTRDQPVAGGRVQPEGSAFDQPHNLVAVGTWELPELWRGLAAGFRLRFTSGTPYERVRSAVYDGDADAYQAILTGRTDARLPAFFQLDLRVDKKWTYQTWTFAAYLEVQNVTNRKNAESITYSYDYTRSGVVSGLPFFPAFGLRAEY